MDAREISNYNGHRIMSSNGPVSSIGLDGLVLPMMPDLGISIGDPFIGLIIKESQMLGEELFNLADQYKGFFKQKYGLIEKEGVPPMQVPPKSSHLIEGHNQRLANKLIYSCAIDALNGMPYFDLDILADTIHNSITVAESNNISTLGIPSLMSVMFQNQYTREEVLGTTEKISKKRLEIAYKFKTSLRTIWLLSLPKDSNLEATLPIFYDPIDPTLN